MDIETLVNDPDPKTRGMVAASLGAIDDASSVPPLVTLLSDTDRTVVIAAARSLGQLGSTAHAAFEPLATLLENDDDELRITVLAALAQLQDPRAFAPIVVRLFDANDEIRRNAAAAIGCLGNPEALQPLLVCLQDDYRWVRLNAAWSLGQLHLNEALPPLEQVEGDDDDEDVRASALAAIACIDPKCGIERALDDGAGSSLRMRTAAFVVLGEQADHLDDAQVESARQLFLATLQRPDTDTAVAHDAAGDAAEDDLRSTATWSLGRLPAEGESVQLLMRLVDDPYRWTASYAIEALGILRAEEARDLLEKVAVSAGPSAQLATQALALIDEKSRS